MLSRFAGAVAGSDGSTLRADAPLTRIDSLTDTLGLWISDPPKAPRGVYFDDVPGHPTYLRYRVVARSGQTIACGYIQRDESDDQLRMLFLAFLERRDPASAGRLRIVR
jgi:hypothetical protein